MKFLVYILVALGMLCVACSDSLDSTLDRAEALVVSHPDSAYALLSETSWDEIASESRKARYAIIVSEALAAFHEKPESDSMIAAALAYYDRSGADDPVRLAKALYYSAIAKKDAGLDAQAIAYAMRARDIVAAQDLPFWEARAWTLIADLYSKSFDYFHAIQAHRRASDKFKEAGKLHHYQFAIIDMAMTYGSYGTAVQGINILDSLWSEELPYNADTRDYSTLTYALLYSQLDDYLKSLTYLDSLPDSSDYFTDSVSYTQYIGIRILPLIKLGMIEEADSLLEELNLIVGKDNFEYLDLLHEYNKAIGDSAAALANLELHVDKLYDIVRVSTANSALSAGVDYYKEQYRDKAREQRENRKWTFTILSFIFFFLLAAGMAVWNKMRRQARELNRRKDEIALLSEDAENTYRRMAALEKSLAGKPARQAEMERFVGLYKEQYQNLDRLICSGVYSASIVGDTHFQDFYTTTREIFSPDNIAIIEEEINREYSGIVSELKQSCPGVSEEMRQMMDLVIFGIGSKTISIVFGKTPSNIYTSLSRTRSAIMKSGWSRAEEFCALIKRR